MPELFVNAIHRALTVNVKDVVNAILYFFLSSDEFRRIGREASHGDLVAQIVLNRIRQYEVAVSQTLHQCRRT